ncbi:alpha/beta hydrolase [Nocardia nova]|nr:alpha/beta hydrolase [Nocardia nova]
MPVLPALAATAPGRAVAGGLFYGSPKDIPPQQFIEDAELFRNATEFDPVCRSFGDYVFTDPGSLLDIPVTIAWGSRDRLLPARSQPRRARLALPRARHIRLGGVGHAIVTEDPVSCRLLLADKWR